jgi:hypothetical protein
VSIYLVFNEGQPGTDPGLKYVGRCFEEKAMRKTLWVALVMAAAIIVMAAKESGQGTLVSENSVACGSQAKGKKSTDLMCQEYVIRTDTTEYHVRQEKQSHKELLPMNSPVEYTMSKDKMKFKLNGKEYEMLVVSESAVPAEGAAPKQ